jgi:uncharacterized membrane protein YqjE
MGYQSTAVLRSREQGHEPSVSSALERVLDASERVIIDRIDLMRLDTHETVARTLRAVALLALGGVLLCSGWFAAMAIVILVLNEYGAPATGYAVVACLSVAMGASLVAVGMQRLPGVATRTKDGPNHG